MAQFDGNGAATGVKPVSNATLHIETALSQKRDIDAGVSIYVPAGYQRVTEEQSVIDGTLIIDGESYVDAEPSSAGGSSILLETNGAPNGSQTTLNLVAGTNVTLTDNGTGSVTIAATGGSGSGTVTSVALSMPGIFSVSGSPITTSGTFTVTFTNEAQNTFFAGPTSGSGTPTFRVMVAGDLPTITLSGVVTGSGSAGAITTSFASNPTFSGTVTGTSFSGAGTGLTGTASSLTSGSTNALQSATTTVNVSSATAPTSGQVLTATSSTTATWQTPSTSGAIPWYGGTTLTPPNPSSFTWVNQGTSTASLSGNSCFFTRTNFTSPEGTFLVIAYSGAKTATIGLLPVASATNQSFCIIVRDSSTGKFVEHSLWSDGSAQHYREVYWNSVTSFSSIPRDVTSAPIPMPVFLRIQDDGTNFIFGVSADLQNFITVNTLSRTAFLTTPDQFGFGLIGTNNNPRAMSVIHWSVV